MKDKVWAHLKSFPKTVDFSNKNSHLGLVPVGITKSMYEYLEYHKDVWPIQGEMCKRKMAICKVMYVSKNI